MRRESVVTSNGVRSSSVADEWASSTPSNETRLGELQLAIAEAFRTRVPSVYGWRGVIQFQIREWLSCSGCRELWADPLLFAAD